MSNYEKYLKYKNKYHTLLNNLGGSSSNQNIPGEMLCPPFKPKNWFKCNKVQGCKWYSKKSPTQDGRVGCYSTDLSSLPLDSSDSSSSSSDPTSSSSDLSTSSELSSSSSQSIQCPNVEPRNWRKCNEIPGCKWYSKKNPTSDGHVGCFKEDLSHSISSEHSSASGKTTLSSNICSNGIEVISADGESNIYLARPNAKIRNLIQQIKQKQGIDIANLQLFKDSNDSPLLPDVKLSTLFTNNNCQLYLMVINTGWRIYNLKGTRTGMMDGPTLQEHLLNKHSKKREHGNIKGHDGNGLLRDMNTVSTNAKYMSHPHKYDYSIRAESILEPEGELLGIDPLQPGDINDKLGQHTQVKLYYEEGEPTRLELWNKKESRYSGPGHPGYEAGQIYDTKIRPDKYWDRYGNYNIPNGLDESTIAEQMKKNLEHKQALEDRKTTEQKQLETMERQDSTY